MQAGADASGGGAGGARADSICHFFETLHKPGETVLLLMAVEDRWVDARVVNGGGL
ncbi:MAG: hypothetical protein HC824_08310 [Synechococcales cyanobacterium RM1_1_8]|nr:hypothetical protein [Synechococcales cyanobacterium RM1_1_8]